MAEDLFTLRTGDGEYARLDPPCRAIEPRDPAPRPPAAPPARGDVTSAHGSCARDGRVRTPLGSHVGWTLRWRAPIPGTYPRSILATDDRIVVAGGAWRLFTAGGEPVAQGHTVAPPTIAPDGTLLVPEPSGALFAYDLAEGWRTWRTIPSSSYASYFVFVWLQGSRLLLGSTTGERRDAHDQEIGDAESCLEAMGLGDPRRVDDTLDVESLEGCARLTLPIDGLLATPAPDGLGALLAVRDRLVVVGPDLRPGAVFTGSFEPVALSVDDEGWMHVVVATEGERALWVVTPDGGRVSTPSLPYDLAEPLGPPAIGLDRRVLLVGERRMTCYGQDGGVLWTRVPLQKPAGWLVTGDDRFLVAEGGGVAVVDGRRDLELVHLRGERIEAGPCLTPRGALLVATATELLCFER
jgi:hypothetical protein